MDYLNTLEQLKKYYANLLIVQYNGKPKAAATIKLMADLLWVNMTLLQIRDSFDWETALDAQLEIIGKWVGVNRFYNGQFFYFHPWLSLVGWNQEPDNLQGGFSTFQTFDEGGGGFLTYQDIMPTQNRLATDGFRMMIGLKIIKNNISATCRNIDEAVWNYFGGKVYTTWKPDELTYHYSAELSEVMQVANYKNVLPCPTGVRIILREIIEDGRKLI